MDFLDNGVSLLERYDNIGDSGLLNMKVSKSSSASLSTHMEGVNECLYHRCQIPKVSPTLRCPGVRISGV